MANKKKEQSYEEMMQGASEGKTIPEILDSMDAATEVAKSIQPVRVEKVPVASQPRLSGQPNNKRAQAVINKVTGQRLSLSAKAAAQLVKTKPNEYEYE